MLRGMVPARNSQPAFFSAQIAGARRFYRDPAACGAARLAVVCGGCEQCSPQYEIHRLTFPYHGMEFVAQGRGRLVMQGQSYPLVAGTLFVYGPGVAHDITTDPGNTLVKYFVDFAGREAGRMLTAADLRPGEVFQTSAPSDVMNILDDLIRAGLRDSPFSARILALQMELLVQRVAESRIPFGSAGTPSFETYRRCRQAIEEQWGRLATLEQVAACCHVDPAYLCRLFRRYDHRSPYQYLLRLRMNHAAGRLQEAGASVKQVADEIGYGDPFHFSRVFKRVIGVSPSHYLAHRGDRDRQHVGRNS